MTWIETIAYEKATGKAKRLYERIKGPHNKVDNIMMAHSLRPHTMEGHMGLYKSVLHHPGNALPGWLLETIGVYVSMINDCGYCVEHHYVGLIRLLANDERSAAVRDALDSDKPGEVFAGRELAALSYAAKLTRNPAEITADDIEKLRRAGLDDGEILETNQVVAYFNYANRTVLGLGVTTEGDVIGLSPGDSEDPNDWRHH